MTENERRTTGSQRWRAPLAGLTFAAVLLCVTEAGLRLVGFGVDLPLFVPAEQAPGMQQANPELVQRYSAAATGLRVEPIPFGRVKQPDTLRIVVQGASTAAGFPYGRWAGLAGMLGDRLETSFPERRFEVVTTAVAAVNSYALRDQVDEIAAVEPDAVLIYAGHNEYLGLLGAASALTPARLHAATLLDLRLRKLRLRQAVGRTLAFGRDLVGRRKRSGFLVRADEPLLVRAARAEPVAFGGPVFERGLRNFEDNLDHVLSRYATARIPVYLGTLVSNERDQPPLDGATSSLSAEARELWQAAQRAHAAGDAAGERDALSRLLAVADDCGQAWYALATLERAAGRLDRAREAYANARDRDRLPFRAPAAINERIRALAARHGATIVDVRARFAAASPDGIPGHELLLEHVHPNARGYFLLADAFYEALKATGALPVGPHGPDDPDEPDQADRAPGERDRRSVASRAAAEADMPITAVDRVLAEHAVRELKAHYPFTDTPQPVSFPKPRNAVEALAARLHSGKSDWLGTMEGLLQFHRRRGELHEARVVARMAAQAYPRFVAPNYSAGMLYLEAGQPRLARLYLERGLAADPSHEPTIAALARLDAPADGRK